MGRDVRYQGAHRVDGGESGEGGYLHCTTDKGVRDKDKGNAGANKVFIPTQVIQCSN